MKDPAPTERGRTMIVGCTEATCERLAPRPQQAELSPRWCELSQGTHDVAGSESHPDVIVLGDHADDTVKGFDRARQILLSDTTTHLLVIASDHHAPSPAVGALMQAIASDRSITLPDTIDSAALGQVIAMLQSKAVLLRRLVAVESPPGSPTDRDELTGLANRTLLLDRVRACMERQRWDDTYHFAVLAVGLDRFKIINDSLGRDGGDRLIVAVAQRVQSCIRGRETLVRRGANRAQEFLARIGGDEFVLIADDLDRKEAVTVIARRLQEALSDPFYINGEEVFVSASIGIALGTSKQSEPQQLVNDAITALNRAKDDGANKYCIFDDSMHDEAMRRLRLEADMRRAIDRGEFILHYQPIVVLQTAEIKGFEALVRWRLPNGSMVSPAEFIPYAEENGLIVQVGQWVLHEAAKMLQTWNDSLPPDRRVSVAVNISKRQMFDATFLPALRELKLQYNLRPDDLHLEITESVIMDDPQRVASILCEVRSLGYPLHMDDFGTGYSSLSCLHHFPLSVLKIDRQFIMNMDGNEDYEAIVHAIVAMAHHMRMQVIAEGLETSSQLRQILATGCDYGQGYFFSKPVPAEEAWNLLHSTAQWRLSA